MNDLLLKMYAEISACRDCFMNDLLLKMYAEISALIIRSHCLSLDHGFHYSFNEVFFYIYIHMHHSTEFYGLYLPYPENFFLRMPSLKAGYATKCILFKEALSLSFQ